MAAKPLIDKIHDLSDLELAVLICLVAKEHCIIDTEPDALDALVEELELVATRVFGLSHAVIDCSEHTSLDDFAHAILSVEGSPARSNSPIHAKQGSYFLQTPTFHSISRSPISETSADNTTIANVILAKNLNEAPKPVQIQALELMQTRRIYTRTSVQQSPKQFLFIALLAGGEGPRLVKHLNEHMFISHFHDPEEGFLNLEEKFDDGDSISSVVKRRHDLKLETPLSPRISTADVEQLAQLSEHIIVSVELKQYQQNIISFLRLHRAVAGGISATATRHLDMLTKCIAPLHGLCYATPSLIAIAARKVYPHRIQIVEPENERSRQWGSDIGTVRALLEGIDPEDVIDDVLGSSGVEAPL